MDVLVEMHKNMSTMFTDVVAFFAMDPKKTSLEDFFGYLSSFLKEYEVGFDG